MSRTSSRVCIQGCRTSASIQFLYFIRDSSLPKKGGIGRHVAWESGCIVAFSDTPSTYPWGKVIHPLLRNMEGARPGPVLRSNGGVLCTFLVPKAVCTHLCSRLVGSVTAPHVLVLNVADKNPAWQHVVARDLSGARCSPTKYGAYA